MIDKPTKSIGNNIYGFLIRFVTNGKQGQTTQTRKTPTTLKAFYKFFRILHIYISMVLFALLAFFCVTGIFLNHNDWFSKSYLEQTITIYVTPGLQSEINSTQSLADGPTAALQTLLKDRYNLKNLHQLSFDDDAGEIIFDYQLPAGYATAYFTQGGDALLEYRKGSIINIMNDLHKGRHSGPVWSWVIDISAVFMLLFSVAGLIILIQNKKYRRSGLILGAIGLTTPFIIYGLWVPTISGV